MVVSETKPEANLYISCKHFAPTVIEGVHVRPGLEDGKEDAAHRNVELQWEK